MYRSRNRPKRGGENEVKGPNSALTQFLREEGISAENIKQKWYQRQSKKQEDATDEKKGKAEDDSFTAEISRVVEDEEIDEIGTGSGTETERAQVSYDARMKLVPADSDEEEYETSHISDTPVSLSSANDRESLTKKRQNTAKIIQNRRRKRKRAADLLDRRVNKVSSLQSLCITKISENISKWQKEADESSKLVFNKLRDVLGGVSTANLNNLAKALSKNRALNDHTLQLFLKTDLKRLTFSDCSKISFDGYKTLAIFSPHLTELSLQMCGQLNHESLLYIAEKLPNLKSLNLDGPFLINEDTWEKFFVIMKGRLEEFHISNTHRFTDKSLSNLLINCGSTLVSLGLSRLDSISNYALLPQYLVNDEFHSLCIEYPFNEEDVNDEIIINLLGQIGRTLRKLVLNGCIDLTDSMIINGLTAFIPEKCPLEILSLEESDQITTDSLSYFFSKVELNNLIECSFRRCLQLGDMAIIELLLNGARDSLRSLNLNSLKELTKEAFVALACPNLTYLDLGFVRCVDDSVIQMLGEPNPNLTVIDVFGDNLVTEKATMRPGLTLIGRQSDSI
ncbi:ALI_HP2_G0025070.mRNA.1.CDS.1 [Saccharomyces cerevisiae]|nr:ALI_HP2_G0025070.mRNA.1.CDS.1 [Saccharomyces cerevisiae]CAI6548033.1 ALI_HP2_G0025070.mRNA.1.CDS.1 [Saccharomyces cerevisiae]CAI6608203.1 ALI_HP1_G0031350.mRNA.1.CDS.1 [Saccharomyces cerevisiae]CAI6763403.1 ALI_collapsed_G0032350.mRNA.1.CDS.1 [Saccharomyces cerevisiae]